MRPWLLAGAINFLVAAVLLGVPYARGPERAERVPGRFAAFAACFYDAAPLDSPGLGLPLGERTRYASLVLRAGEDWPRRCRPSLEAIPDDESMFLFPGVKNAEAQVRAAVALMATELSRLADRREAGDLRVADRPARAMARLRGALAELGLASGVPSLSADRDALELSSVDDLPIPSIVPLRVSRGRAWDLAVEDGAVLARTMDSRAVVYVNISDAGLEQRVTRKPRLVSGIVGPAATPWVMWSTSPATCEASPEGCDRRATGLAALMEDRQTLEPMVWLGAHPMRPASRSVHVSGRVAHVLATQGDGGRVARFELPEPRVRALGEEREAIRNNATEEWALEVAGPTSVAWLEGPPLALAFAGEGAAALLELAPGAAPVPFAPPAGRHPQVSACGPWVAVVSELGGVVRHRGGETFAVEQRIDPPDAASLRVVCRGETLEVWTLAERSLSRAHCSPEGCLASQVLHEDVAAFDALSFLGDTLVASTDHSEEGLVRVTRLAASGTTSGIPAPCWSDPPDGLCGEPRLATDGSLVVVATRQEEDLRVISSRDGVRFENLAGLEQR